jgi:hypothetical protein
MPALDTRLFSVTRYYVYGDETRFSYLAHTSHIHLFSMCMYMHFVHIDSIIME